MNKITLRILGTAAAAVLVLGAMATACFADAEATATKTDVKTYVHTRAESAVPAAQNCRDEDTANGNPVAVSSSCASSGATSTSTAYARAYNNGNNRGTSERTTGSGFHREKPEPGVVAVTSNDTLNVQVSVVGANYSVQINGQLSGATTPGAGEYEGDEIFVAIYPDQATADLDWNRTGAGAHYYWKARFIGGLTLQVPGLGNGFVVGDFTVGGGKAIVGKTYTVPVIGIDDDELLFSRVGAGGGGETAVPTLSTWGLLGFTALLLGLGAFILIRRRTAVA